MRAAQARWGQFNHAVTSRGQAAIHVEISSNSFGVPAILFEVPSFSLWTAERI
jgi:hypothetical protein